MRTSSERPSASTPPWSCSTTRRTRGRRRRSKIWYVGTYFKQLAIAGLSPHSHTTHDYYYYYYYYYYFIQVGEVFEFERRGAVVMDVAAKREAFRAAGFEATPRQVQNMVNALGYVHRGAARHFAASEAARAKPFQAIGKALEANTELGAACLELVARAWADDCAAAEGGGGGGGGSSSSSSSGGGGSGSGDGSGGAAAAAASAGEGSGDGGGGGVGAAKKALALGQLVSLDWTIGVSVASSQCDPLLAPFVRLVFKVADANGTAQEPQAVELTYGEFQEMKKTFKDVAAMIERL